jgi:hypothetical protein
MDAAACGAGMRAPAALACHLSPIRPKSIAAMYAISSNRIMMSSFRIQSHELDHTPGPDPNRLHNGIGRHLGIGELAIPSSNSAAAAAVF